MYKVILNSKSSVTKERISTNLLFNRVTLSSVNENEEITKVVQTYIYDKGRFVFMANKLSMYDLNVYISFVYVPF